MYFHHFAWNSISGRGQREFGPRTIPLYLGARPARDDPGPQDCALPALGPAHVPPQRSQERAQGTLDPVYRWRCDLQRDPCRVRVCSPARVGYLDRIDPHYHATHLYGGHASVAIRPTSTSSTTTPLTLATPRASGEGKQGFLERQERVLIASE